MKIAYIAAGAAGMYCGSCIHDNTLAAALIRKGHDVALIPTYTPIRTDEDSVSINRIFLGGVNIYLQQKSAIFRKTPAFIDRLFDSPKLLNWVSRFSSNTDAKELGELTVSMLKGEHGSFNKELQKLAKWLKESYQPDLVQLTNSMFVGVAKYLKQELQVPVLCAMQGEDIFLDDLIEPYKTQAFNLIKDQAKAVDGFISTSAYYSDFMTDYLEIASDKIHEVKLGINLSGYGDKPKRLEDGAFTIGYLARICPEKGLHQLVDAFHQLSLNNKKINIKLKVAGYLGKKDQPYFEDIQKKIQSLELSKDFEYYGEVDREQKISFLNSIDVLSVPTVYKEPKGLFALEAMANSVPVVLPKHGAFPEILEVTGGGLLVEPGSVTDLAKGIQVLIDFPDHKISMGEKGKQVVHEMFSDDLMADTTLKVYEQQLGTFEKENLSKDRVQ